MRKRGLQNRENIVNIPTNALYKEPVATMPSPVVSPVQPVATMPSPVVSPVQENSANT